MASSLRGNNAAPINFFSFIDIITGVTGVLVLVALLLATKVNPAATSSGLPEDEPDPVLREKLNELLDQLSTLNIQNQQLQHTLAGVQSAPHATALEQELADLRERAKVARERASQLQADVDRLRQRERDRDAILGLSEVARQIEAMEAQLEALRNKAKTAIAEMMEWEAKVREAEARLLQAQREQRKLWVIPEPSRTTKEPLLVIVSANSASVERFNKPTSRTVLNQPTVREFVKALQPFGTVDYYVVFYVRPSGIARFEELRTATKRDGYEVGYDALEEQTEIVFSSPEAK